MLLSNGKTQSAFRREILEMFKGLTVEESRHVIRQMESDLDFFGVIPFDEDKPKYYKGREMTPEKTQAYIEKSKGS